MCMMQCGTYMLVGRLKGRGGRAKATSIREYEAYTWKAYQGDAWRSIGHYQYLRPMYGPPDLAGNPRWGLEGG
jgi:hypothetical protein